MKDKFNVTCVTMSSLSEVIDILVSYAVVMNVLYN